MGSPPSQKTVQDACCVRLGHEAADLSRVGPAERIDLIVFLKLPPTDRQRKTSATIWRVMFWLRILEEAIDDMIASGTVEPIARRRGRGAA